MRNWGRRLWMKSIGLAGLGGFGFGHSGTALAGEGSCPDGKGPLALSDFRPKSMLHVPVTRVETPRRPSEPALPAAPSRRHRGSGPGRGKGAQGPEEPRPVPSRAGHRGTAGQGRRPAVRPDVGGLRGARPARLHPRGRSRGLLPAHRLDYAPAPVPPQGRWRIYGLGLPDAILKKVYADNAVRVMGLDA